MKLLLLAALIALAACAPPPPAVQVGPPMCIVAVGDTIREIPCPTDRVSRSQPSTTGAVGSVESQDRETPQ